MGTTQTGAIPPQTREVFDFVRACAAEGRLTTYSEVARATGFMAQETSAPLRFIWRRVCEAEGLPHLNAIVVNHKTKRPGKGYSLALDEARWRAMVERVFAYDWSAVTIEGAR